MTSGTAGASLVDAGSTVAQPTVDPGIPDRVPSLARG